jgi:hypothetical protein
VKRQISIRYSAIMALAFASGFWPTSASSQPSVVGQWGPVLYWPYDPACYGGAPWIQNDRANGSIHTHLLPTGKVMIYPYQDCPRLWDPANETNAPVSLPGAGYNAFCGGHSHIPDGRLLVAGGTYGNFAGQEKAAYFNPFDPFNPNNAWTRLPNMNDGRWYPSSTTLANGDVLVTAGYITDFSIDPPPPPNTLPQVWQVASHSWRDLTNAHLALPLYPRTFLAPNGKVFFATSPSLYLDTSGAGAWSDVSATPNTLTPGHGSYATPACMDDTGKVYWLGGSNVDTNPPTAACEKIDLNAASPRWTNIASMPQARKHHHATILPDGKFLVTGGSATNSAGGDGANVNDGGKAALLYDPVANTWTTLATEARYRGYHSCAVLLPDGRVLSAGGDQPSPADPNAQIFSPPYLFNGTNLAVRPTITSAPTGVGYGQTFFVGTPDCASITKVTWTRLGSVTHSFNWDQRINVLSFTPVAGGLNVTAPGNPNLCPPGYYLLWILNGSGVPSLSRMVRITAQTVTDIGYLNNDNQSYSYGVSSSGRVTGPSFLNGSQWTHAYRSRPNETLNEMMDPNCNIHSYLTSLFGSIYLSAGYGIYQVGTGPIEVVGECSPTTSFTRPFWYFENGSHRVARLLTLPYQGNTGRADAVIGNGGAYASAVVGYVTVNGYANACYWSVATNADYVYNYGASFYPGQHSYATDTDRNKTIGYHKDQYYYRAFIIDNNAYDLAVPAYTTDSFAYGMITNAARIAGSANVYGTVKPILWSYSGSGQSTYIQLPIPSGKTHAVARDVDECGFVVGYAYNTSSDEVAVYWPSTNSVVVMNNTPPAWLGWYFRRAYRGDCGKIVGVGEYGGSPRAWLYVFD